jgi:myosin V
LERLLGVGGAALREVATVRELVAGGERLSIKVNAATAADTLAAIARRLYGRLFDALVRAANAAAAGEGGGANDGAREGLLRLGVLDIFGFENMPTNGFDQLLINFANEQLHNHFVNFIFNLERSERQAEGLSARLLDDFPPPPPDVAADICARVFVPLDEQAALRTGTDGRFVATMRGGGCVTAANGRGFVVAHFAGDVPCECCSMFFGCLCRHSF